MLVVGPNQQVYDDGCCHNNDDDVAGPTMIMRWLVATATLSDGGGGTDHTTTTVTAAAAADDLNENGDDIDDDTGRSVLTDNLIAALRIYVPIWLVGMILYCLARKTWPRTFAVRQWVVDIRTTLAHDQFGYFDWLWKVRRIADDELLHEIGLDALCFLRLIRMGLRLSWIGMFNSLWLIPVYITVAIKGDRIHGGGGGNDEEQQDDDEMATVDAASDFSIIAFDRLHKNELYYICTVLASYVFFGYTYYTILHEFRWFVRQRHCWLSKLRPQNYTILVRNIPKHLRSDITLQEHFNRLYGAHRVLSAHCCLFLHHLEAQVQRRTACCNHLERAVAEFQHRGKRPTHLLVPPMGPHHGGARHRRYKSMDAEAKQVDSIDTYTRELVELDEAIGRRIRDIEQKGRPKLLVKGSAFRSVSNASSTSQNDGAGSSSLHSNAGGGKGSSSLLYYSRSTSLTARRSSSSLNNSNNNDPAADVSTTEATMEGTSNSLAPIVESHSGSGLDGSGNNNIINSSVIGNNNSNNTNCVAARANVVWAANRARAKDLRTHRARYKLQAAVRIASTTIKGETDGTPDDAGFVTFTSLVAMHGALQMKQHSDLFAMETEVAPEPSEIFWRNVGKDRKVLQTGRLVSFAMTLALCLFWTFIVSFIVSLTDPEHLANVLPTHSTAFLDRNLWIGKLLKISSPILLLLFNSGLLPIILKAVSRFECPASESVLEASAFWKMAAFTVIQTFLYVSMRVLFFFSIMTGALLIDQTDSLTP
jgi:hypothetical protein